LVGLIPPLNEHGYLPAGVHPASIEEVITRFGVGSEQREAQGQSLRWLVPLCLRAGIVRILINGSFVTDRLEPNDVDCVLLEGANYDEDSREADELREGLPFIEIKIVGEDDYRFFAHTLFASDRDMITKGVVEVLL
jgi:hypothetical protein